MNLGRIEAVPSKHSCYLCVPEYGRSSALCSVVAFRGENSVPSVLSCEHYSLFFSFLTILFCLSYSKNIYFLKLLTLKNILHREMVTLRPAGKADKSSTTATWPLPSFVQVAIWPLGKGQHLQSTCGVLSVAGDPWVILGVCCLHQTPVPSGEMDAKCLCLGCLWENILCAHSWLSVVIRDLAGSESHLPCSCHCWECNCMKVQRKKKSCGIWFKDG